MREKLGPEHGEAVVEGLQEMFLCQINRTHQYDGGVYGHRWDLGVHHEAGPTKIMLFRMVQGTEWVGTEL